MSFTLRGEINDDARQNGSWSAVRNQQDGSAGLIPSFCGSAAQTLLTQLTMKKSFTARLLIRYADWKKSLRPTTAVT